MRALKQHRQPPTHRQVIVNRAGELKLIDYGNAAVVLIDGADFAKMLGQYLDPYGDGSFDGYYRILVERVG